MHISDLEQWIVGAIFVFLLVADGARIVRVVILELVAVRLSPLKKPKAKAPADVKKSRVVVEPQSDRKATNRKAEPARRAPP